MAITNEQKEKLNKACKALQDAGFGTILQELQTSVDALELETPVTAATATHTVVAEDVGETNTVVDLVFTGTPVAGVFTVLNDVGVEISGYTVAYALNKATVTIAKASLPVGGQVSAILW